MLTPHERRAVLLADRSKDAVAIADTIAAVMAANPEVTLLDCEMALRAAAGSGYLIGTGNGCKIVIGMPAWIAALDRLGRTPQANRDALAVRFNPVVWWRLQCLVGNVATKRVPCHSSTVWPSSAASWARSLAFSSSSQTMSTRCEISPSSPIK